MKAITVTQPWATLIATGYKKIETRSWKADYRGPLAIHAASYFPDSARVLCFKEPFFHCLKDAGYDVRLLGLGRMPFGAVVATCRLVSVVRITADNITNLSAQELAFGDFRPGRWAWGFSDMKILAEPIPVRGHQGLWEWVVVEGADHAELA
jgi:hypothetical protein